MAVELSVPVVPVHISGTFEVLPKNHAIPRRRPVRVRVGKPLLFQRETTYTDATNTLEEVVKALGGW